MIKHHILETEGILVVEPISALSADDFGALTSSVDNYLTEHPTLHGILVHAQNSPGWESFAGLSAHLRFVREHHRKIERVALVTDSPLGTVVPALAKHFVSAQIRHFAYSAFEEALLWLKSMDSHPGATDDSHKSPYR
jgi:hypothetical protein